MPKTVLYLTALLWILPAAALAQDLYSGVVPVQGQGADERAAQLPQVLRQVLQKQSGLYELPAQAGLEGALQRASELLIGFQYQDFERLLPDGSTQQELQLQGRFQPDAVDHLVRELGLPRWRHERQPVVLWVVIDDGRGRVLMPEDYRYAWQRVEEVALARGLPVAWPGLSDELLAQVDLQLLWGGYTDQLLADGAAADGVVIVAAHRQGPEWNLRWTFADRDSSSTWQGRAPELELALAEGTHQLVNHVATAHSIGPAGAGSWQVELLVQGLRSGADYARCLGYLQGLSLVDSVAVLSAGENGMRFRLELNTEPEWLQRAIEQDRVLARGSRAGDYRYLP